MRLTSANFCGFYVLESVIDKVVRCASNEMFEKLIVNLEERRLLELSLCRSVRFVVVTEGGSTPLSVAQCEIRQGEALAIEMPTIRNCSLFECELNLQTGGFSNSSQKIRASAPNAVHRTHVRRDSVGF